jgi:triphosphoribosyl-dephospho-CoA synthase
MHNADPVRLESPTDLGDWVWAACLMECTARKPGNVHPDAAFDDLCHADFVNSADAIRLWSVDCGLRIDSCSPQSAIHNPQLRREGEPVVGRLVLSAVRATWDAVGKNTNLGIVLLLAPLAAVEPGIPLRDGIADVLRSLTDRDAELVYEAIRLSQPGGMGRVADGDLASGPTGSLREMMQLAADRDAIARQYATDFDLVLNVALPRLQDMRERFPDRWEEAVIQLHLELMARCPDTLIARKCGAATASESARRAERVLQSGWPDTDSELRDFDRWLRGDGHRRNPGTTADLVTATLFAALRERIIASPITECGLRIAD